MLFALLYLAFATKNVLVLTESTCYNMCQANAPMVYKFNNKTGNCALRHATSFYKKKGYVLCDEIA